MKAPYRRFSARELRLSRSIDRAREQLEAALDADDAEMARPWRRLLLELEELALGPAEADGRDTRP